MKRWAVRIMVFVILGAIVNVAVAWGLAFTVHANATNPIKQGWRVENGVRPCAAPFGLHTHWLARRLSRPGSTLIVVTCIGRPGPDTTPFDDLLPPVPTIRQEIAQFDFDGPTVVPHPGKFYWDGRGWPCVAMSAHWRWFYGSWPDPPITSGISIPGPKSASDWPWGYHDLHALPLAPLWPGFAINTFFYAAVLWGLFAAPFALRRRSRIKRGLCPKCAYDLRGADSKTCPECGTSLSSPSRREGEGLGVRLRSDLP